MLPVAAAYAIGGWVFLQIGGALIGLPGWLGKAAPGDPDSCHFFETMRDDVPALRVRARCSTATARATVIGRCSSSTRPTP